MNKDNKQTNRYPLPRGGAQSLLLGAALLVAPLAFAQDDAEDEDIFELSPFTVEGSEDQGYRATSTMAGSRIRTDLKDVGSAISVVTEEFLRDTGAVDNASLLQYTTSTEVGGIEGNFAGEERLSLLNPNANTRVRGLQAADNTRDYFLSNVPWDGYNVSRVDMQRGPNAILSGLGSPAGIVNNTTDSANYTNEGEVQIRFGSYGSTRVHFNVNRVILEDQLGIRVAAVKKDDKYRQEEAWAEDERFFVALKYEPNFLKKENALTTFSGNFESGTINSNRPRTRPPVDRMTGFWKTHGDLPAQITGSPLAFAAADAWLPTGQPTGLYDSADPATRQPILGSRPVNVSVAGVPVATTMVETGTGYDAAGNEVPIMREVPTLSQISFNHPWYGENYTDGPVLYFGNADSGDGNPTSMWIPGISSQDSNVLTVNDGQIVRDLGGTGHIFYRSIMSPASTSAAARDLGLPLADIGVYNAELLWDRSIFDYKNHLLDGDNKRENQNFKVLNLKVAQTLFDNRLGFEAAINNEVYEFGQTSPFGWSPEITIDVNETLGDLVTPNPNVGRPVIFKRTQGSSNLNERERDSYRLTAFAELREGDLFESDSFLGKLISKQRLTAVKSSDDITFYEMGFKNWLADDAFRAYQGLPGMADNTSEVMTGIYMGPSVIGTSGPQGLNLQPLPKLNPKGIDVIHYWDNTWANASTRNVNFLEGQTWYHVWDEQYSAEQDNPGNYVGWTTRPVDILVDTEGDRLDLITTARSQTEEVTSQAAVWQGFFWDGAVVATYGIREDEVLKYNVTAPRIPDDPRNIFDPAGRTRFADIRDPETGEVIYNAKGDYLNYTPADAEPMRVVGLGGVDRFEDDNESKSLVVHLDQFLPELPGNTKLSVFWNESSNFQPAETRVDHMNRTIAPPTGTTEDYGFLIRTFDDRLSFKVTQYETLVNGATFGLRNLWYVGTAETSLFAAGMRDKAFLDGVPGWSDSWRGYANSPYQAGDGPWESYLAARGEASRDQTAAEAQEWQERALNNLEQNLAPQEFWDAWGATKSDARWQNGWWDPWSESTGAQPAGFTTTSDLLSKGTEFELTYNPVENWNIAFNASKTEAVRDNLAGSLKAWVDARNEIHNGDNGDIRLWWSGDRNNTLKTRWNREFYSSYQLALQQEGLAVDELREWRYNLVTNYTFRDGRFKGLGVGGSYRWQDKIVIGYPQSRGVTESGNEVVFYDINNPYYGPSEDNVDLWASYSTDLNDDISWRIQLNVRDVLADGELIPLSVNPDGSTTEYRLGGDTSWFITNTFSF